MNTVKKIFRILNFPLASWMVFLIGLLVTGYFSHREYKTMQKDAHQAFESEIQAIETAIKIKIEFYENVLYQTRAFLTVGRKISRDEFNHYVKSISLISRFPGIQALSYTVRIPTSELQSYEAQVRKEGNIDYHVWPTDKREEYFAIKYLSPLNWRNERAIGYDMFTESNRRAAMTKARDTGLPAMTKKLTLVQETKTDPQPGLILFLPIYSGDELTMSLEERRKNLTGFISSPFRTRDLFRSIFYEKILPVDFEIYDTKEMNVNNLLFDQDQTPHFQIKNFNPLFSQIKHIEIKGQIFTLFFSTLPTFENTIRFSHIWILLGGVVGTLLLTWIMFRTNMQAAESRRLHEKLFNESRRLNAVLQQMPEGVIISEPSGKLIMRNEQVDSLIGGFTTAIQLDEASGIKALNHEGKVYKNENWPLARSLNQGEIIKNEEMIIERESGKTTFLNVNSSPIKNDENQIIAGVVIFHDITEIKKIQSELEQAVSMRDEFLSIASHELKTPMTSLKLQIQMLLRKLEHTHESIDPLKPNIQGVLILIDKQVSTLNRLVEDMLDISRLRTGNLKIEVSSFSMGDLITETLLNLEDQIKLSGYSAPTVRFSGDLNGVWDRMRLGQVLINLITNSMKYGNKNLIDIQASGTADLVKVCVSDRGIGISNDDQLRIFDRFERAISPSEVSGLGLGLFISKQIIKAHGGDIWVKSVVNKGSTFTFEIPKISV